MGWVVNATPRPLYLREIPGTHCTEGWVGPRADLNACGKSHPKEIRSPDPPACSKSLYRLSYPSPLELAITEMFPRIPRELVADPWGTDSTELDPLQYPLDTVREAWEQSCSKQRQTAKHSRHSRKSLMGSKFQLLASATWSLIFSSQSHTCDLPCSVSQDTSE
jgi:hypothetical protein